MRKGVALFVALLVASGTAASKDCEAGETDLLTAYQKVALDWESTKDFEGLIRGLGDLIRSISELTEDCFKSEKVKDIDAAHHCPSAHYSLATLRLAQLSINAEALITTEVTKAGGELGSTASLPQFPGLVEGRVGCFADCEADFLTLYERVETLVLDLGSAPSRVLADLLRTVLQLAPLLADCSVYLF